MKTLLVGYGKMGRILESMLLERGHTLAAAVDPAAPGEKTVSGAPLYRSLEEASQGGKKLDWNALDAAIEFTRPDTAPGNISFLVNRGVPVVTGTTGWYEQLPALKAQVEKAGGSLVYSANFSLGVNLFYRIAEAAAHLMAPFPEYDLGGYEIHHNKKADSPSGTARTLVEKVLSKVSRKTQAVYEKLDRPPAAGELHFASLRVGAVPGVHSLIFDSAADTIEITHRARGREGFASGALTAAQWLSTGPDHRPRQGVFTMDDVLADLLE